MHLHHCNDRGEKLRNFMEAVKIPWVTCTDIPLHEVHSGIYLILDSSKDRLSKRSDCVTPALVS